MRFARCAYCVIRAVVVASRGFAHRASPTAQSALSERSAWSATLRVLRLQRVRGRAGRCRRAGTRLRRADHDARVLLQIARGDLRALAVGDADPHAVRGEHALGVDRPQRRHAAGLRARGPRTTWGVRATRTAGEATAGEAALRRATGYGTRCGRRA